MKQMVMTMIAMVMVVAMNAKSHKSVDPVKEMSKVVNLDNLNVTGRVNNDVYGNITLMGNHDCHIAATLDGNSYKTVMAVSEEVASWSKLVEKYNEVVKRYTKKYGTPDHVCNVSESSVYIQYGMEMTGLRMGKVMIGVVWNEKDYTVNVQITKGARVAVRYDK